MVSHVTSLLADLERTRKALNQVSGHQLNSASERASIRTLVEKYFNNFRPQLKDSSSEVAHIKAADSATQELLTLCHKRGSLQKYKDLLRTIKENLVQLDSQLVSATARSPVTTRAQVDARMIVTLRELLPSAALSYEQALIDLDQSERLSWRGPATDLREALRETLDHLAPDEELIAAPGYKQETGTNGPTMKQKVRFILRKRGKSRALSATTEDATSSIDEAIGSFVRSVYTRSSISTHTPTEKSEVARVLDLVRVVLSELLEVR